jgi:hypothetical protein
MLHANDVRVALKCCCPNVSALASFRRNGHSQLVRKRPTTDASAQNNGYDEPFQRKNDYDEIYQVSSCC